MEEPKLILVKEEVLNKVIAFLAAQPYNQVAQLLADIQQTSVLYETPKVDHSMHSLPADVSPVIKEEVEKAALRKK